MQFQPKRFQFPRLGVNFHTLAPLTLLLIFLALQLLGRPHSSIHHIYELLGLSRAGLLNGHIWQLITYLFLHGNFSHWLTNALFIYYFGGRIHDIFGEREVWRTASWSALAGGLLHLVFQGDSPLVGASAIAIGLLIALTTVSPESKMFPLPIRARNLRNGILLSSILLLFMIPSLSVPFFGRLGELLVSVGGAPLFQIGHACHLGGALAAGLTMRTYLRKPITLAQLKKERAEKEDIEAA